MENTNLENARHSLSHILAMAVLEMFPEAKLGIGPAIENGFYYDFELSRPLTPADLPKLEQRMREMINKDLVFEPSDIDKKEAKQTFKNQPYKLELIKDIPGEEVSIYRTGDFVDLCAGPHLDSTKELKDIGWKLDKTAGAYWRGSEKNKMLQRIYGLAFENKEKLDEYIQMTEEAGKRDHRKLGAELDLFSFHEEGPGFAFWHPKGMILWNTLLDWWREEHRQAGYEEVKTPMILSEGLWHTSGHWDHYRENMYFTKIDDRPFAIRPMNCPGGILIYKNRLHSYREFPIRLAEVGLVHRHELGGVLMGLMRVRAFHQDDAHIYVLPEQVEEEVIGVMNLIDKMYKRLDFSYHVELSTKPKNGTIGSDQMWQDAEDALRKALEKRGIEYKLNPGDGAFYGPKIDFHITDAIGRTWQTGTIQLDLAMPECFDLEYTAANGSKQCPIMIHRTVFGSFERFIGVMIEHFAGAFPAWLAPVQVIILPIAERHNEYVEKIFKTLKRAGARVEIDNRNESVGKKIRESEMQKVPFMLVVGDKEMEAGKVAVRKYGEGDKGLMDISEIIHTLSQ